MLQLDRILFPTDGSSCAECAYEWATQLADPYDLELHMLHFIEERTNNLDNLSELIDIREEDILPELRIPVPQKKEERKMRREKVANSSAADGILEYADTHDIDLIVMGTHGRRGVERLLMGSVAEEAVRLFESPVVTMKSYGKSILRLDEGT